VQTETGGGGRHPGSRQGREEAPRRVDAGGPAPLRGPSGYGERQTTARPGGRAPYGRCAAQAAEELDAAPPPPPRRPPASAGSACGRRKLGMDRGTGGGKPSSGFRALAAPARAASAQVRIAPTLTSRALVLVELQVVGSTEGRWPSTNVAGMWQLGSPRPYIDATRGGGCKAPPRECLGALSWIPVPTPASASSRPSLRGSRAQIQDRRGTAAVRVFRD
jgi:hypothetical protein